MTLSQWDDLKIIYCNSSNYPVPSNRP
uniref:Uncharacterized protein n=1 Tax=Anguilla anguilla TaxID=7936 RepID=A0A0E9TBP0_ANGAN